MPEPGTAVGESLATDLARTRAALSAGVTRTRAVRGGLPRRGRHPPGLRRDAPAGQLLEPRRRRLGPGGELPRLRRADRRVRRGAPARPGRGSRSTFGPLGVGFAGAGAGHRRAVLDGPGLRLPARHARRIPDPASDDRLPARPGRVLRLRRHDRRAPCHGAPLPPRARWTVGALFGRDRPGGLVLLGRLIGRRQRQAVLPGRRSVSISASRSSRGSPGSRCWRLGVCDRSGSRPRSADDHEGVEVDRRATARPEDLDLDGVRAAARPVLGPHELLRHRRRGLEDRRSR